jgi:hypothetical protein
MYTLAFPHPHWPSGIAVARFISLLCFVVNMTF